jgi:hypothetical protein
LKVIGPSEHFLGKDEIGDIPTANSFTGKACTVRKLIKESKKKVV